MKKETKTILSDLKEVGKELANYKTVLDRDYSGDVVCLLEFAESV